jgi:hypothetical protein
MLKSKVHPRRGHVGPEQEYRQLYSFSNLRRWMGVGGQWHVPAVLPRERPGTHLQEVWTGAENPVPTGIRSPDLSARSESLYRLRYQGPW